MSVVTNTFTTPAFSIRSETQMIDVTSNAPRRDPDWTYIDHNKHLHTLAKGLWPTLTWIIDETYWCTTCGDEHANGHWECRECGERIEPGMIGPSGHVEKIRGLTSYYLDDQEITEDEAAAIMAHMGSS